MDNAIKTVLNALKNATKIVAKKAAEGTGELKKIPYKIVKSKPVRESNSRNVEETLIAPDQKEEIWTN